MDGHILKNICVSYIGLNGFTENTNLGGYENWVGMEGFGKRR